MHFGQARRLETTFVQFGDAQAPEVAMVLEGFVCVWDAWGGLFFIFLVGGGQRYL